MGYYKKVEISGVNTAQLPVLSALQAKELFRRYHDGDESARELLIEGNLRLVLSVIKRFENRNEDMDDLFQVGVVGLLKAIENFNPDLDVMPSSYLCPMISGEVDGICEIIIPFGFPVPCGIRHIALCRCGNGSRQRNPKNLLWMKLPKRWDCPKKAWYRRWMPYRTRFLFLNQYTMTAEIHSL